jgi:hypothetical protein
VPAVRQKFHLSACADFRYRLWPSSRKIVERELDRRLVADEFQNTELNIREIAEILSHWLTRNYPYHAKMTAKTIENVFREKLRLIVNSQKAPK